MAELSIDPDYLRRLVVKVRSFMAKEETDIPDDGSNPIDDEVPLGALQDEDDDLSREEVVIAYAGRRRTQRQHGAIAQLPTSEVSDCYDPGRGILLLDPIGGI